MHTCRLNLPLSPLTACAAPCTLPLLKRPRNDLLASTLAASAAAAAAAATPCPPGMPRMLLPIPTTEALVAAAAHNNTLLHMQNHVANIHKPVRPALSAITYNHHALPQAKTLINKYGNHI